MRDVTAADIRSFLNTMQERVEAAKDELITMDAVMGDGDLGLTMSASFTAAVAAVNESPSDEIGGTFVTAGMAVAKAAPSTMGTLLATGLIRAGKALADRKIFDSKGVATFFAGMADGIHHRGKAELGDKTVLDVVAPVAERAKELAAEGAGIEKTVAALVEEADVAFERTTTMVAKRGRLAYHGERSSGVPDPGATVATYIVRALKETVEAVSAEAN